MSRENVMSFAEKLIESILKDRMEFKKNHIDDIILILPKRNFDLLKHHYTAIMNIPIMSIVLQDKTELPMHRLFGMDIEIIDIQADYILKMKEVEKR